MSLLFVVSHLPHRPRPHLTPEPWLQPWGRHLAALLHSLHCYQMHIPVSCFLHCSFQPPPYHFGSTIFPFLFFSPHYMAYYVHILHLLDAVSTTSYSLIPWKGLLRLSVIEITSPATVAIPVPEPQVTARHTVPSLSRRLSAPSPFTWPYRCSAVSSPSSAYHRTWGSP